MLCLAQTGGKVKHRRRFFGGLKTRVIFYEKDKNRIAILELIIRLFNLKRRVLHLAGTKNSSWTDRCQKSGRFEIKRF